MDGGNQESNECPVSGSSEEPPDSNMNEISVSDNNSWCHLKTITTFNSEYLSNKCVGEQYHSQREKHTSDIKCFCNQPNSFHGDDIKFYKKKNEEKAPCSSHINFNSEHFETISSHLQNNAATPSKDLKSITKKVPKSTLKPRRLRRRSQSNSLSEGDIPHGTVADPISHFSMSSNSLRNGTMSDIGAVNPINESMRSCTPDPVQSLTRFSPTSLLVESLIDQLCKLMEKDSAKQKKLYHVICERLHQMRLIDDTYTIEEFQFMRSHYQKALYQLLAVAKSSTQSPSGRNILLPLPSSNMNVDIKISSEQVLEWSRYQHEYHELEYIAKGGFGHVYKARNKLDGGEYAIKKIFLRYRYVEGFLRSLKEVKMLARLNHPNIVSYKAAWLEPLDDEKAKTQRSSPSSESQEASLSVVSLNSDSRLPLRPACLDAADDSLDIVFLESSSEIKKKSVPSQSVKQQQTNHPLSNILETSESTDNSNSINSSADSESSSSVSEKGAVCPMNAKQSRRRNSTTVKNWATLYVQMQLCERTLRQWLDVRNASLPACALSPDSAEGNLALNLFRKIVRGVDYIHTQGIVHHDIKPSNIFVNSNLKEVQVGDFGLSCCILSRVDSTGVVGEHHGEVGTRMYAAPEQLRGKCSSKSDLFSLGIVFLELLQPFHTDMERSKVIQKLRSGHLPSELTTTWPHAARLISDLIITSPMSRPTASDLLQRVDSLLRANLEHNIHSQLASKDETIRLLKEAVASRDQEIAELRQRLSSFEK